MVGINVCMHVVVAIRAVVQHYFHYQVCMYYCKMLSLFIENGLYLFYVCMYRIWLAMYVKVAVAFLIFRTTVCMYVLLTICLLFLSFCHHSRQRFPDLLRSSSQTPRSDTNKDRMYMDTHSYSLLFIWFDFICALLFN